MKRGVIFAVALLAFGAAAADYPVRPIRMIVPQAPGSASDTVARIIAAELTQPAEAADRRRQPSRRRAAARPGPDLESDSRRLHHRLRHDRRAGDQPQRRAEAAARRAEGSAADRADDDRPDAARGPPGTPFKSVRDVIDYAKQNPGKLFERVLRQRHAGPRRLRAVQVHDRHARSCTCRTRAARRASPISSRDRCS